MPRPPMPAGEHGTIQLIDKGSGQWQAKCRFRDHVSTTIISRMTPPNVKDDPVGEEAKKELLREINSRRRQMGLIDPQKRHRLPFSPHGFYVYILWGSERQCPLYIGLSTNVLKRVGQHFATERGRLIKDVEFIECKDVVEMEQLEIDLITSLLPVWNTTYNPRAYGRSLTMNMW